MIAASTAYRDCQETKDTAVRAASGESPDPQEKMGRGGTLEMWDHVGCLERRVPVGCWAPKDPQESPDHRECEGWTAPLALKGTWVPKESPAPPVSRGPQGHRVFRVLKEPRDHLERRVPQGNPACPDHPEPMDTPVTPARRVPQAPKATRVPKDPKAPLDTQDHVV